MAVPSFVGVLGRSPEDLPSGRPQVRDRHHKFHEGRDTPPPLVEGVSAPGEWDYDDHNGRG